MFFIIEMVGRKMEYSSNWTVAKTFLNEFSERMIVLIATVVSTNLVLDQCMIALFERLLNENILLK